MQLDFGDVEAYYRVGGQGVWDSMLFLNILNYSISDTGILWDMCGTLIWVGGSSGYQK